MLSEESRLISLRKSRRRYYNTWKPLYCPALDKEVFFNAKGFSHLNFRTNNTPRSHKEAIYKLKLLPLARSVIRHAVRIEKYQKREGPIGGSKRILKQIEYWSIVATVGKRPVNVRVILRKVESGQIHFWSIMKVK